MKRRLFLAQLLLASALLAPRTVWADAPATDKPIRVFSLGNSFTGNSWAYLRKIATAAGRKIELSGVLPGGCSLERHWEAANLGDTTPDDPKAKELYKGKTLKEAMGDGNFDFVTIQQFSVISYNLDTYRPYAANLKALIAKYAPNAELVIHETWAYRVDDPLFTNPTRPYTQAGMAADVAKNYRTIAAEIGVKRIIPSGDAFALVNSDPNWGFKPDPTFNPQTAVDPALPDQSHSLNVGYFWKKGTKPTLQYDGHHANQNGCYLAGCVWFETLCGQSVIGNTFIPDGMSAETAAYLQQKAHEAVEAEKARAK